MRGMCSVRLRTSSPRCADVGAGERGYEILGRVMSARSTSVEGAERDLNIRREAGERELASRVLIAARPTEVRGARWAMALAEAGTPGPPKDERRDKARHLQLESGIRVDGGVRAEADGGAIMSRVRMPRRGPLRTST